MKRMVTVSPELRLALKKRIDAISRQAIAAITDFRYTTLGQKLEGLKLFLNQQQANGFRSVKKRVHFF